jgi:hypothetical protein
MSALIYTSQDNAASRRLLKSINFHMNSKLWTHFDDLQSLTADLHIPRGHRLVAILFPANHEELAELVSLRHLLCDKQIILILPNTQPQTISNGHALRPRFISYADSDFSDVAAVYDKMTARRAHHFLPRHRSGFKTIPVQDRQDKPHNKQAGQEGGL